MSETKVHTTNSELVVDTPCGRLVAEYWGDPGIFDGIAIALENADGKRTNIAVVETATEDTLNEDSMYPTTFHTFVYNGDDEEPSLINYKDNSRCVNWA